MSFRGMSVCMLYLVLVDCLQLGQLQQLAARELSGLWAHEGGQAWGTEQQARVQGSAAC